MHIEQKQNRIYRPQSNTTLSAEESNQVTTELENLITEGGLTPNAGTLTQVKDSVTALIGTAANNLQSQIDAITSASDVFDVVGTYTDLQNYDTSTVPTNDIIKVLQDSTHNDAATYYRWNGSAWVYVGKEGPYYTKSEINADFALKTELPSIATTSQIGLIKPDGSTVSVQADGTLSVSSNVTASLPLFTHIWVDHIINDASYLLANTFSWQSGSVYTAGYNHLVNDIAGKTAQTETIGSYTITFYLADDGHKVVLADQETIVQNIYGENGCAWYYILDTVNVRFKLPIVNPSKEELITANSLPVIGNGTTIGLTNGTNTGGLAASSYVYAKVDKYGTPVGTTIGSGTNLSNTVGLTTEADKSGMIADLSNQTTVFSGKKYLYFYVGNFSQSAIEQTAGLNSSLFNSKVDLANGVSQADVDYIIESYRNGTEWYRVYKSGWCEQGGYKTSSSSNSTWETITLLKNYIDTNYHVSVTYELTGIPSGNSSSIGTKGYTVSSFDVCRNQQYLKGIFWETKGQII